MTKECAHVAALRTYLADEQIAIYAEHAEQPAGWVNIRCGRCHRIEEDVLHDGYLPPKATDTKPDAYERGKRDGAAEERERCLKSIDDEMYSARKIARLTAHDRDTAIEFLGYVRQAIAGGAR